MVHQRVLMTGVGGFVGSHCLEYFLSHTDWEIIGLDSFYHKGIYSRIIDSYPHPRVKIFNHNLAVPIDSPLERRLLDGKPIDLILNVASDSAVERSLSEPTMCLRNNHDLIINMLEFARRVKPKIFFQISTDEVYGDAPLGTEFEEWSSIVPNNPYAASKACQEAIAISYWRSFDVPVVLTNTVNNFGEKQDPEKFLPTIINNVYQEKVVPIYADSIKKIGSRFYLYAKNHADAFVFLSQFEPAMYKNGAERPDRYNIGCNEELDNLEFAAIVAEIMHKELKFELIPSETARKGYDRRYALNSAKLTAKGWKPPFPFRESLEKVIQWTLAPENSHWIGKN